MHELDMAAVKGANEAKYNITVTTVSTYYHDGDIITSGKEVGG